MTSVATKGLIVVPAGGAVYAGAGRNVAAKAWK
jgi:hypothetical protein